MKKEQAIKEWQYGTQTPSEPCNDYAPDTLAPEQEDRETCTTCYHHRDNHTMKTDTQNIFDRLNTASLILRDNEQYNDDPDYNPEGLAADACDDAAALIKHLAAALREVKKWTLDDEQAIVEHGESATIDGCLFLDAETLNNRIHGIRKALDMVGL
jgi:hypothetical protein